MPPRLKKAKSANAQQVTQKIDHFSPLNEFLKKQILQYCDPESVLYISKGIYLLLAMESVHSNSLWQYWTIRDCHPPMPPRVESIDLSKFDENFKAVFTRLNMTPQEIELEKTSRRLAFTELSEINNDLTKLKNENTADVDNILNANKKFIALVPRMSTLQKTNVGALGNITLFSYWNLLSRFFDEELALITRHNISKREIPNERLHWKTIYLNMRRFRDEMIAHLSCNLLSVVNDKFMMINGWLNYIAPVGAATVSLTGIQNINVNGSPVSLEEIFCVALKEVKRKLPDPEGEILRIYMRDTINYKLLPNLPTKITRDLLLWRNDNLNETQRKTLLARLIHNTGSISSNLTQLLLDITKNFKEKKSKWEINCIKIIKAFPQEAFNKVLFQFLQLSDGINLIFLESMLDNVQQAKLAMHQVVNQKTLFDIADELENVELMQLLFAKLDISQLYLQRHLMKVNFSHWMLSLLLRYPVLSAQTQNQLNGLNQLPKDDYEKICPVAGGILALYISDTQHCPDALKDETIHNQYLSNWLLTICKNLNPNIILTALFDNIGLLKLALNEKVPLIFHPLIQSLQSYTLTSQQKFAMTTVMINDIQRLREIAKLDNQENQLCSALSRMLDEDFIIHIVKADFSGFSTILGWGSLMAHISPAGLIKLAILNREWVFYVDTHLEIVANPTNQSSRLQMTQLEFRHFTTTPCKFTGLNLCHSVAEHFWTMHKLKSYFNNSADFLQALSYCNQDGNSALHFAAMQLKAMDWVCLMSDLFQQSELTGMLLARNHRSQSVMDLICARLPIQDISNMLGLFSAADKSRLVSNTLVLISFMNHIIQPTLSAPVVAPVNTSSRFFILPVGEGDDDESQNLSHSTKAY